MKRHPSVGFILMLLPPGLYSLRWRSGKRVQGESDLLSLCALRTGHHTGILRELSSISEENITVLSMNLHLSLNLQLNIMVSIPYFCHVFDSYDL